MALSPAHRFGQIIGDILEMAVEPLLTSFARKHKLYLDMKGHRPCRKGRKCTWIDLYGNRHDLDYVLERGGTPEKPGMPVAFIETAWRRYTKHSRNKAQEIQGAVLPLVETYRTAGPFIGAILAGTFTEGALMQLKSLGFSVLYLPYDSVISTFGKHGINAHYDEATSDADIQKKVEAFERLNDQQRLKLAANLLKAHQADVDRFIASLSVAVSRQLTQIIILPLHGHPTKLITIDDAVNYIQQYDESEASRRIDRYEVIIRYSNGDKIESTFHDKTSAIRHLRLFQPVASASSSCG